MATNTDTDAGDGQRYPTVGADSDAYERYRAEWTDGELLVYDTEEEGAWIQSESGISLDFMR